MYFVTTIFWRRKDSNRFKNHINNSDVYRMFDLTQ